MAYRARTKFRRRGGFRRARRRSDLIPFSDCNTVVALVSTPEADCTDPTQHPGTYAVEFRNLEGRTSGSTFVLD